MNKIQIDEAKGWEVLDALTLINQADGDRDFLSGAECYAVDKAITVLREALAEQPALPDAANRKLTQQLEQEWVELRKLREAEQPAQRTWVGLTDEDKAEIKKQANYNWETTTGEYASKVQALTEAKLKEKNT